MRELAERLGVSAATVNAIEHGKTGISVDRLNDLARTFAVPASALLGATRGSAAVPGARTSRPQASVENDVALNAAISSFVAAGYHGTSMRTIAARAGLSLASIYHYYPSKQSLLVKILDMAMDDLDWRFTTAGPSATDPLDKLYRLVETLALFHAERADLAYIGASEMRSVNEPDRSRIAMRRNVIQHQLDEQILRAVRDGAAECAHPNETGRAIATMCTSLPQWFDRSGPTSPKAIAKTYAELALRMIGARSKS
jgi:AcrR family transcriptional regulator/DNA-binding XRE family transcriptional regulator